MSFGVSGSLTVWCAGGASQNVAANHRANDVIVKEGDPQLLSARFMYGPLDMVALSGEKVDLHLMRDNGQWTLLGTQLTDRNGRLGFCVPRDLGLGYGLFPVKAIVRWGNPPFVQSECREHFKFTT